MKIIGIGILAFGLFLLQRYLYQRIWNRHLFVSVRFSQSGIREGEEGEVVEVVENRKRLPLPVLKCKFQTSRNLEFADELGSKTTDQYYRNDMYQIGGGERITRKLRFVGRKRGYYRINGIDLVGTDLFMTREFVESRTASQYLYVYPGSFPGEALLESLRQLNGEVLTRRHLTEDPFEYRGLREYQPGDDIRSVNWKATARTGELKVNQKNYTALQTIRLFLNTEDNGVLKKEEAVEACLQIAQGAAAFFLAQGIQVSCYGNAPDVITREALRLKPSAGKGQMESISRGLARMDTSAEALSFVELFEEEILDRAGGALTLFVSPNGYDGFLSLLERCGERKVEYLWFCPLCGREEPKLPQTVRKHVRML